MSKVAVRQAIEYGVDKQAVQAVTGEAAYSQIASSVITPDNAGYHNVDLYPSSGERGDVVKCPSLLGQAGYAAGRR
jgi:peptide/nickel transport system substrate-binding protein